MPDRYSVVSLRRADFHGAGDARRAASVAAALQRSGARVDVHHLLHDGEGFASSFLHRREFSALLRMVGRWRTQRPLQWLMAQALAEARSTPGEGIPIFITSRLVPDPVPPVFGVDFVDSLATNALARAELEMGPAAYFWRREARLLQRVEENAARAATVATAVSKHDAQAIHRSVQVVCNERTTRADLQALRPPRPRPRIVFAGNLYYQPNHEAALWVLKVLLPELLRCGWSAKQIVVAGRRPRKSLTAVAQRLGIDFQPDVSDLPRLLESVDVAVAPMMFGSGVQTKVVDALAAGLRVVLTEKANRGLDLKDSDRVRIVPRDPERMVAAIESLLLVGNEVDTVPEDVQDLLVSATPAMVQQRWRELFGR